MRGMPSVALVALAAAAGCGGHGRPAAPAAHAVLGARVERAAPARVTTRTVSGLGRVLVDGDGRTLYAFLPDARTRVECVAACASFWVPLRLAPGQTAVAAAGGARRALVGSVRAAGGRVATYAGWPLYRYAADAHPGLAKGQGALLPEPCTFLNLDCSLRLDGPVSYALAPSGALVRRRPGADAVGP
jgi:predicted lipoprotein with Yx(FWY)xxD motif